MLPLYHDPHFTFRFAEDRIIPRFHREGIEARRRVFVFKIDPGTGERLGLLARATAGEDGWVDLGGADNSAGRRGVRGVSAGDGHQVDFLFQIVFLVAQRLRVAETIGTKQKRSIHRHNAFHAVGEELLQSAMWQTTSSVPPLPATGKQSISIGKPIAGFSARTPWRSRVATTLQAISLT